MKVFLSWSGEKSQAVATALRDWMPQVINSVEPFMSATDIAAGARWEAEIADQLQETSFGIICVTVENQHAPWLNFEAGALAKGVGSNRVVPLAVDLKQTDVTPPLGQFQGRPADKMGVAAIMRSINEACTPPDRPLAQAVLDKAVEKWWPDLERMFADIDHSTAAAAKSTDRSDRELLEEVLATVRSIVRHPTSPPAEPSMTAGHPLWGEVGAILRGVDPAARAGRDTSGKELWIVSDMPMPEDVMASVREMAAFYGIRVGGQIPHRRETEEDEVSESEGSNSSSGPEAGSEDADAGETTDGR